MTGLWVLPILGVVLCLVVLGVGKLFAGGGAAPPLRPGWLCGVVGLRGHGKSLFVARLIAERLKRGESVVANFPLEGRAYRMLSWEDAILAPPRSMVVIDEGSQWCGSAAGKSLDELARWYVSQCRKLHHEVWIICQDETQLAGEVRAQVNEWVECKKVTGTRHRAASYSPRQFRKAKARPLWAWHYRPKGAAIRVYDTHELLRPVAADPLSKGEKVEIINGLIDEIYRRRGLLDGDGDGGDQGDELLEDPRTFAAAGLDQDST